MSRRRLLQGPGNAGHHPFHAGNGRAARIIRRGRIDDRLEVRFEYRQTALPLTALIEIGFPHHQDALTDELGGPVLLIFIWLFLDVTLEESNRRLINFLVFIVRLKNNSLCRKRTAQKIVPPPAESRAIILAAYQ